MIHRSYDTTDDGGREVVYTSGDGRFEARSRPYGQMWCAVSFGPDRPDGQWDGPFRSEQEAMRQARTYVRRYEDGAGR